MLRSGEVVYFIACVVVLYLTLWLPRGPGGGGQRGITGAHRLCSMVRVRGLGSGQLKAGRAWQKEGLGTGEAGEESGLAALQGQGTVSWVVLRPTPSLECPPT